MENDIIDVELDDDSYSAVNRLLEIARKKTFATIDDILQVFPEAEQNVDQLEEAFSALQNVGIPYIEDPTEEDEVSADELDLLADDLEPFEIEKMRKAGAVVADILKLMKDMIKPGVYSDRKSVV